MLSRLFPLRRQAVSSSFLAEKLTYFRDASCSYNLVTERGISTARTESSSGKPYANFAIFKGKAALFITPVSPTFIGPASGHQRVDKNGVVLFKFIPAIGAHKYDSERKQYFGLSATEVGCLISLGPVESCEFFHDPSMKTRSEGQVKKTLSISPFNDGGGYVFNLSVMDSVNKTNERFTLPVTKAEFSVMRTTFGFVLPHILGWDRLIGPQHGGTEHGQPHGTATRPHGHARLRQSEIKMVPDSTEHGQPHGPRLRQSEIKMDPDSTEHGQPNGTATRPQGHARLRQSEIKMVPDSTEHGQPHGSRLRQSEIKMDPDSTEHGQPNGTATRPHGLARLRQSEIKMDPNPTEHGQPHGSRLRQSEIKMDLDSTEHGQPNGTATRPHWPARLRQSEIKMDPDSTEHGQPHGSRLRQSEIKMDLDSTEHGQPNGTATRPHGLARLRQSEIKMDPNPTEHGQPHGSRLKQSEIKMDLDSTEHGQPNGTATRPHWPARLRQGEIKMDPDSTEHGQPHGSRFRQSEIKMDLDSTEHGQPNGTATRPHWPARLRQSEIKMDPDSEWVR